MAIDPDTPDLPDRRAARALRSAAVLVLAALVLVPVAAVSQAPDPSAPSPEPADLQSISIREATLAARIGATRNRLSRLLGALQRFSRDPPPPLLVPPSEALDSVRAAILIRALTPDLERRARTLEAEARTLGALRRAAAAADGERFAEESAAADLQRVDGLLGSQARPAAVPAAAMPPPALVRPAGGEIVAPFGGRLTSGAPSRGLEFAVEPFAPVSSPSAGVVDYAGPLDGWGRVVILRAGVGYHMVLAGLATVTVQPGQSVASGQAIGLMSGQASPPPRLYLEVRRNDEPIDPRPLIAATRR